VGAQALGHDALRVLVRLGLIVCPRDAGRERGHHASGHFHVPSRGGRQRLRELARLGVPTLGGAQIVERGLREEADEGFDGAGANCFVALGGGAVHAYIVPDSA